MTFLEALKAERENDPSGLGYTNDDVADAALINSTATGITRIRDFLTGEEVLEAIDEGEQIGLFTTNPELAAVLDRMVQPWSQLDISSGSKARDFFLNRRAIPQGDGTMPNTFANLLAVATESISRAQELGFRRIFSRDFTKSRTV